MDQLTAEYNSITESYDDITAEQSDRIDAIDERLNEIEEARTEVWSPDLLTHFGAIVAIGEIKRGLMKKVDHKSSTASDTETSIENNTKEKDENALSATLIHDLTSHKSAALSAVLAKRSDVALAATVYTMIRREAGYFNDGPLKITVSYVGLSQAVSEKGVSKGLVELEKIGKVVKKGIPPARNCERGVWRKKLKPCLKYWLTASRRALTRWPTTWFIQGRATIWRKPSNSTWPSGSNQLPTTISLVSASRKCWLLSKK